MAQKKIEELLREAAAVVAASDVPEDLRSAAFKEAVNYLREAEGGSPRSGAADTRAAHGATRKKTAGKTVTKDAGHAVKPPDEDAFFSELAHESGVKEQDLRDVLHLTKDGKVQVSPPTRMLGASVAEQTKTLIALVSGARAVGLGEKPVNAEAVRREAERKRCYDPNNFAGKHLRPLKGFNSGSNRNEILLTSRWLDEFKTAVAKAHGQTPTENAS
jgi:hypothetical protein